jgi:hypothetical protein
LLISQILGIPPFIEEVSSVNLLSINQTEANAISHSCKNKFQVKIGSTTPVQQVSESFFMRAAKGFGKALYMFYEFTPIGSIAKQVKWGNAFQKVKNDQVAAIQELMNQMMLLEDDRNKAFENFIKNAPLKVLKLKESETKRLTQEDWYFIEEKVKEMEGDYSDYIKIALARELFRMIQHKEEALVGSTGFRTIQFIKDEVKKAKDAQLLSKLLHSSTEHEPAIFLEADKIIDTALSENKRSVAISAICAIASTLGFVGIGFAFALPAALPLYLILAGIILSNLVIFGFDIYKLIEEIKATGETPKNGIEMLVLEALFIAFTGIGPYLDVHLAIKLSVIFVGAVFATARIGIALFAPKE